MQFGALRLDRQQRQVLGPQGPIALSSRSFDILQILLDRQPEPVSKDVLLGAVWPGIVVEENTLQVHISALRKVLPPKTIITVHGRGYQYAGPLAQTVPETSTRDHSSPVEVIHRPVIAVMPFASLSFNSGQQQLCEGMVEGLVHRLSRFRQFSVLSFPIEDPPRVSSEQPQRIWKRLGVDYVVTGSIQRSGDRVRVSARLLLASNESTVWGSQYDRPVTEVFDLQDEVSSLIAGSIVGRVEIEAVTKTSETGAPGLSSYERALRGYWHFKQLNPSDYAKAAECFQAAIAEHPTNADAFRGMALLENNKWLHDFEWEGLIRSRRLALRAIELDPANALCHAALGFARMWLDGVMAAWTQYDIALALNPEDPHILSDLVLVNCYLGDTSSARDSFAKVLRINALPPVWLSEFRAIADFLDGNYAGALPDFLSTGTADATCAWDTMYALACYGLMGNEEGVRGLLRQLPERSRRWNFVRAAQREPFRDPVHRERLLDGLKRALRAGRWAD